MSMLLVASWRCSQYQGLLVPNPSLARRINVLKVGREACQLIEQMSHLRLGHAITCCILYLSCLTGLHHARMVPVC
jgi:hypothetical protein